MGSLFPFIGLNLFFWVVVGFVRFIADHAYKTIGIHAAIRGFKRFMWRYVPTVYDKIGIVGIILGYCAATIGFTFFSLVTGANNQPFIATTPAPAFALIAAWVFFAIGAGYVAARIERERAVESGAFTGVLYFFHWAVVIILFSAGNSASFIIVTLFSIAVLSSVLGARVAEHMNLRYARRVLKEREAQLQRIVPKEVAAIVAAHNEEKTIEKTIESLTRLIPVKNIHIGSDASTDRTVEIARALGANVIDINPNIGKANVLARLIKTFHLTERFKAVIIVDADSELEPEYLKKALPLLDDPKVAAVAVHALSKWSDEDAFSIAGLIRSYRVRFYRILQATFRYGQTWKRVNVSPIVPGFASMYRASALAHIEVNAPGLVIEDFNMTFEVHHKKLGVIAYLPNVRATSRDPLNIRDYIRQVSRWNLGLWQTIRRHGVWKSAFSLSLMLFLIESVMGSLFIVLTPFLVLFVALSNAPVLHDPILSSWSIAALVYLSVAILILMDYVMTLGVALYERKAALFVNGLAFMFFRYIDAVTFLYALPLTFFARSDGRWVSPKR